MHNSESEYTPSGHHKDAIPKPEGYPSAEEARAEARRALATTGCQRDDCDVNDPDRLTRALDYYAPSCPAIQQPPGGDPYTVLCDDHARSKDQRREDYIQDKLLHAERAVAVFECGVVERAEADEQDEVAAAHGYEPIPMLPAECPRCGSDIVEVRTTDE